MRRGAGPELVVPALVLGALVGTLHCGDSEGPLLVSPGSRSSPDASVAPTPASDDAGTVDSSVSLPPTTGDASTPVSPGVDAQAPPGPLVAYASGYAQAIDVFSVDPATGALGTEAGAGVRSFGDSPSFLAVNPAATTLYAVDENASGEVGAYAIDATTGALTFLNSVSSGGNGPPFVRVDATGKYVFVANYGDGTVSVLPVTTGGKLGAPLSTRPVGAMAHMMIPDPTNHFVFVPCLGADYVAQFVFDETTGDLTPNAVPTVNAAAGAGPRHLAFHPNGRFAYVMNETNSTMTAYAFDSAAGTLTQIETHSTIPTTFTGTNTGAEVWVHPSGNWVFGSNRGDDSIVTFAVDPATGKMTLGGFTPAGGASPRDFSLDPTGTFLYVANQTTGNVVPFRFDATHGTLTAVGAAETVSMASFVGVVRLPSPHGP